MCVPDLFGGKQSSPPPPPPPVALPETPKMESILNTKGQRAPASAKAGDSDQAVARRRRKSLTIAASLGTFGGG